jgi:hypothetical protein
MKSRTNSNELLAKDNVRVQYKPVEPNNIHIIRRLRENMIINKYHYINLDTLDIVVLVYYHVFSQSPYNMYIVGLYRLILYTHVLQTGAGLLVITCVYNISR